MDHHDEDPAEQLRRAQARHEAERADAGRYESLDSHDTQVIPVVREKSPRRRRWAVGGALAAVLAAGIAVPALAAGGSEPGAGGQAAQVQPADAGTPTPDAPSGAPSDAPSALPSDAPSGAPSGAPAPPASCPPAPPATGGPAGADAPRPPAPGKRAPKPPAPGKDAPKPPAPGKDAPKPPAPGKDAPKPPAPGKGTGPATPPAPGADAPAPPNGAPTPATPGS